MKSIWFGVALSLSVAATACGDAPADEPTVEDSNELVAGSLSEAGKSATRALLAGTKISIQSARDPSAAAFGKLAQASLSEAYVHAEADGSTRYFFEALVLEGDIVSGDLQLVMTETHGALGFEAGPSYTAKISAEARPAGARMLAANDIRAARAILGLAREAMVSPNSDNSRQLAAFVKLDVALDAITLKALPAGGALITLKGVVLEGGDIVSGSATMVVEETLVDDTLGLGEAPVWRATTTVQE